MTTAQVALMFSIAAFVIATAAAVWVSYIASRKR